MKRGIERCRGRDGVDVEHPAALLADPADCIDICAGVNRLEAFRCDHRRLLTLEPEPVVLLKRLLDGRDPSRLLRMIAGVVFER